MRVQYAVPVPTTKPGQWFVGNVECELCGEVFCAEFKHSHKFARCGTCDHYSELWPRVIQEEPCLNPVGS